jgi:hypothetical protein
MISILVCSKKNPADNAHRTHCATTIGCNHEYIRIDNPNGAFGLGAAYNKGAAQAQGTILVFMHEDVFIITPEWGKILENKFSRDDAIGLIGVAGAQYLFQDNPLWVSAGRPFIKGTVIHDLPAENKCILTVFSDEETDSDVVAVDGLFCAVPKRVFDTVHFDEQTFDRFHFYDLDICMQIRKTRRIVVTPAILVKHFSGGSFQEEWKNYGRKFLEKYRDELPATCVDDVPDQEHRVPFNSFPLNALVTFKTYLHIKSIGQDSFPSPAPVRDKPDIIAVTGMLGKCERLVDHENDLLKGNQPIVDTMHGQFENRTVIRINDAIISQAGGSWRSPPDNNQLTGKGDLLQDHIRYFNHFFTGPIIKDPCLCLTFTSWRKYCTRLKRVVICFRHPLGAARSLYNSYNLPVDKGLALWHDYTTRLIDAIDQLPVTVVDYDTLPEHCDNDLHDLMQVLHIPSGKKNMMEHIADFFEADLTHGLIAKEDERIIPGHVMHMYRTLKSRSIAVNMGS